MLTWLMNPAKQAKDVSLQEKLGNLHWKGYRSSFEQNPFIILEMNKLDLKSQMTWWGKKDPKCPVNKDGGWKGSSMTLLYKADIKSTTSGHLDLNFLRKNAQGPQI